MIIYIHGFGSSGEATKAQIFRKFFEEKQIRYIAPSLSTIPDLAIKTLSELIESYQENEKVYLVGASLGGYYSMYLSDKYDLPTVLINPAIYPFETLKRALGKGINYYDNSTYEWNESHLDMLINYEIEDPQMENFFLLLHQGDELLDYEEAIEKLREVQMVVEEGGTHGFEGIERHFGKIREFFKI